MKAVLTASTLFFVALSGVCFAEQVESAEATAAITQEAETALEGKTEPHGETIEEILGEDAFVATTALEKALVQMQGQEFEVAEAQLERFVDELEIETHRFDPDLIEPLIVLGDAQSEQHKYNAALDNYQRAIHLERVNHGLHSIDQVPAVYREADTLLTLGDGEAANKRQEYAYFVLLREHGPYSSALLPGLFHLADWYGATNNIFSARGLYSHAVALIERDGADTEDLIHALQGIADTYRHQRFPPNAVSTEDEDWTLVSTTGERRPTNAPRPEINNYPQAEAALQRIISIRQADAEAAPVKLVESVLQLADWHLLWQKYNRAYPLYEHAHKILTVIDGVDADAYFATPQQLYFPKPRDPDISELNSEDQALEGFVKLNYAVSRRGTIAYGSLETLSSMPEGLMDTRVRRSLNRARFRPKIIAGKPVGSSDLVFLYQYAYMAPNASEIASDVKE